MKTVLIDPNRPQYKANLHCHSTCSDGKKTPEELKRSYMAAGYSVVAFTDHEHLLDHSDLCDERFVAITSCEHAIKEFETLSTLVRTDMKVCHLNLYAKDPHNIDTPCYSSVYDHYINDGIRDRILYSGGEYRRVYSQEGVSAIVAEANARGFLVAYNHPRWSLENATDYLGYKGLWAVEIYNHCSAVGGLYEYDVAAYDDFLRDGQRLACTACDDNHNDRVPDDSFGGFTMILAQTLTYSAVLSAMERRELYASTGPLITSLVLEDGKATLTYEKGDGAFLSTKGRRAKYIPGDGSGKGVAVFDILPTDGYIRFDVVDARGRRANTCAYFSDELPDAFR